MRQSSVPEYQDKTYGDPSQSKGFGTYPVPQGGRPAQFHASKQNRLISTTVFASTTPLQAVGHSPSRTYLGIQNNGTVDLYVGFGSKPNLDGTNALILPANTGFVFENNFIPNNEVYILASTSCRVTLLEGSAT